VANRSEAALVFDQWSVSDDAVDVRCRSARHPELLVAFAASPAGTARQRVPKRGGRQGPAPGKLPEAATGTTRTDDP